MLSLKTHKIREKNKEILTGYDFLVKKARFTNRYIRCTLIYGDSVEPSCHLDYHRAIRATA